MIVCKQCGAQNPEGTDFCVSCGKFLEWSGERVQTPPVPAQPAAPVGQPVAAVPAAPPPPPAAPPPAPPAAAPYPAAAAPPPPPPPPASIPPSEPQPQSRLPQAPIEQRPAPQAPQRPAVRPRPGDLICGQCGMPNDPSRRFCRRCAASLDHAVVVRTPWWRRFIPRRRSAAAGTRPRLSDGEGASHVWRTVRIVVAAAVAVAVLAYVLLPGLRGNVNAKSLELYQQARLALNLGQLQPVHPTQAAASSSVPGHTPDLLIDLVKNDYWAADTTQDAQPKITLTLPSATDMGAMIVTSGAGDDFVKLARPRDVLLTYSDGSTQSLTLRDDGKSEQYLLHARATTSVQIQILNVYPGQQSTQVAIAELEFFRIT